MEKELLVDHSLWDIAVNYILQVLGGVVAFIARAGGSGNTDPQVHKHVMNYKLAKKPFGLYYWIDPLQDGKKQAKHFFSLILKYNPNFIAFDAEQWWANWDLWYAWRAGRIPASAVPVLDPYQISRVTHDFCAEIDRLLKTAPDLNIRDIRQEFFYSATGFIRSYTKGLLADLIAKYPNWLAQYHWTGGSNLKRKVTWKELKEKWLPTTRPNPTPMKSPDLWQWTGDRFTLEGNGKPIDINWFMQEGMTFAEWVYFDESNTGDVTPDFVELKLKPGIRALNIREAPNANAGTDILGIYVPSSAIYVDADPQIPGPWLKIYGKEGYIHGGYTCPV